jgi:uncharacterized RDD family membrane protein YckC
MSYGGFWKRFGAIIIDGILLGILNFIVLAPILGAMGIASGSAFPFGGMGEDFDPAQLIGTLTAMFGVSWFVSRTIDILYHAFMESSKFQGSLGKMALGMKVVDLNGGKIDFVKALIRNVCKIISGAILAIGYIMAGFTDKKQGLHDMIAGTLVVNK